MFFVQKNNCVCIFIIYMFIFIFIYLSVYTPLKMVIFICMKVDIVKETNFLFKITLSSKQKIQILMSARFTRQSCFCKYSWNGT